MGGDEIKPKPFTPLAKPSPSNSDYTTYSEIVIDNITGLEWQRTDDNTTRNYIDAWDYCVDLTLDDKTHWRLPSLLELLSIVNYGEYQLAINAAVFPDTVIGGSSGIGYWTTTGATWNGGHGQTVSFDAGRSFTNNRSNLFVVRCVR